MENFRVNMLVNFRKLGALSRKAPAGYLIEPTSQKIISKLRRHGIDHTVLGSEKAFYVETYSRDPDRKEYIIQSQEKIFSVDTVLVELKQLQKLLIMLLFEPESEASFASLGLISSKDTLLPYYRIVEK